MWHGFRRRAATVLLVALLLALSFPGSGVFATGGGDADDVAAAKTALTEDDFSFAPGDSKDSVTQDFTMPEEGLNATVIEWVVVNEIDLIDYIMSFFNYVFIIARPTSAEGDQIVELRATISKGSASDTKDLQVTLKATTKAEEDLADVQAAQAEFDETDLIYASGDDKDWVTQDFYVPVQGAYETRITYVEKSDPGNNVSLLANAEGLVLVTRPSAEEGSKTVVLTATISKGSASVTKDLTLTIKAPPGATPEAGDIVTFAGADWLCISRSAIEGYKLLRVRRYGDEMPFYKNNMLTDITDDEITLERNTHYALEGWGLEYNTTIRGWYLQSKTGEVITLTFNFARGDANPLAIRMLDSAAPNSLLTINEAIFIRGDEYQEDIATTMILYTNTLTSITSAAGTLVSGTDYSIKGSVVSISAGYLAAQSGQEVVLTFNFSGGAPQTLTITLRDTPLPDGTLNPSTATFVRDAPTDITVKVTEGYYYRPDVNKYETSDVRAFLNDDFYDTFTDIQKSMIKEAVWYCGDEKDEFSTSVTGKIGLLRKSEADAIVNARWYIQANCLTWWLITPGAAWDFMVWEVDEYSLGTNVDWGFASDDRAVRPVLYLKPDVTFERVDSKYVAQEKTLYRLRFPFVLRAWGPAG